MLDILKIVLHLSQVHTGLGKEGLAYMINMELFILIVLSGKI